MSQSDMLRGNKNQHSQKNVESQLQDVKIKNIVKEILVQLREEYPNSEFGMDDKVMTRNIEMMVSEDVTTLDKTYVKPDGGFVWVKIDGVKHYILVSEQKRQGTNDKRLLEGKTPQAMGNAAERLGKNVDAFDIIFGDEDIYPFVVFLQGCDFYDSESTIGDRIRTIASFQPMNQINLYWKQIRKNKFVGGSYYMRGHSMKDSPGSSDWGYQEMKDVMLSISQQALEYYISKYGK